MKNIAKDDTVVNGPWGNNISNSILSAKQRQEIPSDTDLKKWTRPQPDGVLLEWQADKMEGEHFKRAVKLMNASMKQVPAGTLPDNDDFLARLAGYSAGRVESWLKAKSTVMAGVWFKRSDGRWQCAVLTEGIIDYLRNRDVQPKRRRPDSSTSTPLDPHDDGIPF